MAKLDVLMERALDIHRRDFKNLRLYDDYARGNQAEPYGARGHSDEFRALAKRSVYNWIGLAVNIPCQLSIIEGFRVREDADPPEWEAFKGNRLGSKQKAFHKAACVFGHSFAEVEWPQAGRVSNGFPLPRVRGLPTTRTVALYDDPFGDAFPVFAMRLDESFGAEEGGATVWFGLDKMRVEWATANGKRSFRVKDKAPHGFPVVPIARWTIEQDLEGRTVGLVAPLIQPQNETNQAKFDLTVTRNFSSYKVRTASGLEGEPVLNPDGTQMVDEVTGEPIFAAPEIGPEKFLVSEDDKTRFGTLDETPLDGFIASLNQSVEHFAAVSQIPPHALQGRMANLSAEALVAAEEQLMRLVGSLQRSWADTWVSLFQLLAYAQGNSGALDDYTGQVRWREMRARSMGEAVDALGKAAQMLGVPSDQLWPLFPGIDAARLQEWRKAADEAPPVELTQDGAAAHMSRALSGMTSRQSSGGAQFSGEIRRRTA